MPSPPASICCVQHALRAVSIQEQAQRSIAYHRFAYLHQQDVLVISPCEAVDDVVALIDLHLACISTSQYENLSSQLTALLITHTCDLAVRNACILDVVNQLPEWLKVLGEDDELDILVLGLLHNAHDKVHLHICRGPVVIATGKSNSSRH